MLNGLSGPGGAGHCSRRSMWVVLMEEVPVLSLVTLNPKSGGSFWAGCDFGKPFRPRVQEDLLVSA